MLLLANWISSLALAQISSAAPQIWVTAISPPAHASVRWQGIRSDASDMWKPDAAWEAVAAHTQVAMLIAGNIENTSDASLKSVIDEVKRRHYDLALEIGPLVRSNACKSPTEAYGNPWDTPGVLDKIRRNGGDLRYVAMDEPFHYGHRDAGGCHESTAQIAQEVAASVAQMRKIFPRLQVGDTDVVGADREWIGELAQWADAYRAAVGEPLAFFHADVGWSQLAIQNLVPLAAEFRQRHIPLGIIYNADSTVTNDLEWTESAEQHFVEIESVLNVHPDTAIFETWTTYPTNVLPENQPSTLMNVALQYLQPSSSIRLTRSGGDVSGFLTGVDGKPIPNATVTLSAVDVGARMGPTSRHLAGVVPEGAVTGVIGIRAGTEGSCICAGETGAIVGGIHYKEKGTGKPEQDVSPVSVPIQGAPVSARSLALVPGKTFAPNLKEFPLTAGASYTLDTPIAATAAAEDAGYATLVFLDATGKGIHRDFLWFTPSTETLGTAQTGPLGGFRLTMPETVTLAQPEIRVNYPGSPSLRPALGVLPSPLGATSAALPALEQLLPQKPTPLTILGVRGDFKTIFDSATPSALLEQQWEQASKHVQAVYISAAGITSMSDEALARMVRDLSSHHIALGVEILATNWFHEPPCGGGIEGYIDPGSANHVVAKLLKAGGTIHLMAMDEPFWFGHFYSGKNACRSSIPGLASRVAVIVKIYTAAFPNVLVGDTEPFPAISNQPNWQAAYGNWVKAFHSATGTPLTFLHLDFNWGDPQLSGPSNDKPSPAAIASLARQTAAVARENGLLVGMIMNGGGGPVARSDAQWMDQARLHIRALNASGVHLDHLMFESWDKYPARILPETDPNAIGSLILFQMQH